MPLDPPAPDDSSRMVTSAGRALDTWDRERLARTAHPRRWCRGLSIARKGGVSRTEHRTSGWDDLRAYQRRLGARSLTPGKVEALAMSRLRSRVRAQRQS